MSILINRDTKVITQGITGKTGQFHTRMCRDYANGRNCFVAGVNPKKPGEDFEGIPIYATVKDAKAATQTNPFQGKYAWGRSERIEYRTDKGRRLPAALFGALALQHGVACAALDPLPLYARRPRSPHSAIFGRRALPGDRAGAAFRHSG